MGHATNNHGVVYSLEQQLELHHRKSEALGESTTALRIRQSNVNTRSTTVEAPTGVSQPRSSSSSITVFASSSSSSGNRYNTYAYVH